MSTVNEKNNNYRNFSTCLVSCPKIEKKTLLQSFRTIKSSWRKNVSTYQSVLSNKYTKIMLYFFRRNKHFIRKVI